MSYTNQINFGNVGRGQHFRFFGSRVYKRYEKTSPTSYVDVKTGKQYFTQNFDALVYTLRNH